MLSSRLKQQWQHIWRLEIEVEDKGSGKIPRKGLI